MRAIGDADLASCFLELRQRIEAAKSGAERAELVRSAGARFQRSNQWVYLRLKEVGWRSGRRGRKDKGASKLARPELEVISSMLAASTRSNGKRLLSVRDAIEIARANDLLAVGASPQAVLHRLKQEHLHPSQLATPAPHTRMRSLYPNHVWQVDVSVCVLFYLDTKGLTAIDERRFYKNKPQNLERIAKQRVLRYVVTDHYSGAFYFRYYLGAGESQELLFDFLMTAFTKREHPQDPFHGVPEMLVWDAGSANQAYMIRTLLDRLSVKHWAHQVDNPRAKGQNECVQNVIECGFEGRLVFDEIRDLEQLNHQAHVWMRDFCGTRTHSRHGHTRYGLWQQIRPEQLRICPPRETCERLLETKPVPRTVRGDLTIRYAIANYGSHDYSLRDIPEVRAREQVSVCENPYRAPNVNVYVADAEGEEQRYERAPIETDAAGFPLDAPVFGESYRSPPDSDVDRNRKAVSKLTYDAETQADADEARRKRKRAFGGRIDAISYLKERAQPSYMDRPGSTLDVPAKLVPERVPRVLNLVQAYKRLKAKLGRWDPAYTKQLEAKFPNGVPEEALDAIAKQLAGGASTGDEATG